MDENSSSGVDSDSGGRKIMLKLNERILRKRKTYMNNFSESVLALKKRNIVNTIKELAHEINLSCLVTQHMMQ